MEERYLNCQDDCTTLKFSKDTELVEHPIYSFEFLSDYLGEERHCGNSLLKRFKRAWKAFTDKPIWYAEVLVTDKEKCVKFLEDCLSMVKGE